MGASHTEAEDECGCLEGHPWARRVVIAAGCLGMLSMYVAIVILSLESRYQVTPEFWVKLAAVEGLDRSTDASRAPTFNLTLRVRNFDGEPWQFSGEKEGARGVLVAYSGVPIAHADVPEFTAPVLVVGWVPIVATGEGLGLPEELYDRMQSQRKRHERVKLAVHVKLDGVLLWCTAILHGQPEGPFVCPVLYGPNFVQLDPRAQFI